MRKALAGVLRNTVIISLGLLLWVESTRSAQGGALLRGPGLGKP